MIELTPSEICSAAESAQQALIGALREQLRQARAESFRLMIQLDAVTRARDELAEAVRLATNSILEL